MPVRDFANEKITIAENTLEVSGGADNKEYSSKFNLYKEINPDESRY